MNYVTVVSSNVLAIAYDSARSVLGVRFRNGSEYHYSGVPGGVYASLLDAPSVGRALDVLVKKVGYSYVQIR